MIWLWLATAAAHPEDQAYYGHALILQIEADQINGEYRFDIPNTALKRDQQSGISDPIASRFAELSSGIDLKIDGQATPWKLTPRGTSLDGAFTIFSLSFSAPILHQSQQLSFGNANAPEQPSVFIADVQVDGSWRVTDSSLLKTGVSPTDWRLDESMRLITVTLQPRWGFPGLQPLSDVNLPSRIPYLLAGITVIGMIIIQLARKLIYQRKQNHRTGKTEHTQST